MRLQFETLSVTNGYKSDQLKIKSVGRFPLGTFSEAVCKGFGLQLA
jgi:hypothetical protein